MLRALLVRLSLLWLAALVRLLLAPMWLRLCSVLRLPLARRLLHRALLLLALVGLHLTLVRLRLPLVLRRRLRRIGGNASLARLARVRGICTCACRCAIVRNRRPACRSFSGSRRGLCRCRRRPSCRYDSLSFEDSGPRSGRD